jgi:hypothetical protein
MHVYIGKVLGLLTSKFAPGYLMMRDSDKLNTAGKAGINKINDFCKLPFPRRKG